jgi:tetratricopeptide (TPR) repeat protein
LTATVRLAQGDFESSESDLLEALAAAKEGRILTSPLGTSLMNNLAVISFVFRERPDSAEDQFNQALKFIPSPDADELSQRTVCFRNLGIVQESQGRYNEAARSLQQALQEVGQPSWHMVEVAGMLAANRERARDVRAVEAIRTTLYELTAQHRHNDPELFLLAARELGLFFLKTGELHRLGTVALAQVDEMNRLFPDNQRWQMISPLLWLALYHGAEGRWSDADVYLKRAMGLSRQTPTGGLKAISILSGLLKFYDHAQNDAAAAVVREAHRRASLRLNEP